MDATQHDTFALESFHHIEDRELFGEEKSPKEPEQAQPHPVNVAPPVIESSSTFLTQPPDSDVSPLLPSPYLLVDDVTSQLAATTATLNSAAAAIRTGTLNGSQREAVVNQLQGLRAEIDAMLTLLTPVTSDTTSVSTLQRTVVAVPLRSGETSTSIELDLSDVANALTGQLVLAMREKLSLLNTNQ
jgi:hypothetical protein